MPSVINRWICNVQVPALSHNFAMKVLPQSKINFNLRAALLCFWVGCKEFSPIDNKLKINISFTRPGNCQSHCMLKRQCPQSRAGDFEVEFKVFTRGVRKFCIVIGLLVSTILGLCPLGAGSAHHDPYSVVAINQTYFGFSIKYALSHLRSSSHADP